MFVKIQNPQYFLVKYTKKWQKITNIQNLENKLVKKV